VVSVETNHGNVSYKVVRISGLPLMVSIISLPMAFSKEEKGVLTN
jgi:hypothetical protein